MELANHQVERLAHFRRPAGETLMVDADRLDPELGCLLADPAQPESAIDRLSLDGAGEIALDVPLSDRLHGPPEFVSKRADVRFRYYAQR